MRCDQEAKWVIYWPGRKAYLACRHCAADAVGSADAMGFRLVRERFFGADTLEHVKAKCRGLFKVVKNENKN